MIKTCPVQNVDCILYVVRKFVLLQIARAKSCELQKEMSNSEDLEQLISITGADRNVAENLLEACGGDELFQNYLFQFCYQKR